MPPDQTANVSSLIQMGAVVVAAVWSIAKISATANTLKVTVDRMEKTIIRLQGEHTRIDRRVSRLEGVARVLKQDSPDPEGDE